MRVQSRKISKYLTEIFINGEVQGVVTQATYGFWYAENTTGDKFERCRSRESAIDFIKDWWNPNWRNIVKE